jgi:hypothetical protein
MQFVSRQSPSRLFTIPKTSVPRHRGRLQGERSEILKWLTEVNPRPLDLLRRLSQTSTPYVRLLTLVCDEMEHCLGPVRSEKLDELERDSSLTCARLEVEAQRQHERVVRLRVEKQGLQDELRRRQRDLEQLGSTIDALQELAHTHGIDKEKQEPRRTDNWGAYKDLSKQSAALDDTMYRELWKQQQELLDEITVLERELAARQAAQLVEMKAYVLRRFPHLATRRA